MNAFIERHSDEIAGVLTCFDRVVIMGTLPDICHANAMASYLDFHKIRLFDFPRWAEPFREELRQNAERLAAEAGVQIEFTRKPKAFRKENRIKAILGERGDQPGLVDIFSAMESCPSFQPWHDKSTHHTFLKSTSGKCLHYYFYFIDEHFGPCYVRVPTWAPFRLQVYFNGQSWLARQLVQANNLFLDPDYQFFLTLGRGEWAIRGFRAADLRAHINRLKPGRSSYILKRLRTHRLIKKVARTYRYYLTRVGRPVLVTALVIREYSVQPTLVRNAI